MTPAWDEDLCAAPHHPLGPAGHGAQPQGEGGGSEDAALLPPAAWGRGVSHHRTMGAGARSSPWAPRAPSPSHRTNHQHWLTWFQPVFLHD